MDELARVAASWKPGPVTARDAMPAAPASALAAVLDRPAPGRELPPLWHWLYFLEWPPTAELGADGHPADGHFLPPLPDRRRMFAGGTCELLGPLKTGEEATRVSSLGAVTPKQGRSGPMLFVTVRYEVSQGGRLCLVEEQDLVYRSGEPVGKAASMAPTTTERPTDSEPLSLNLTPLSPLLFRYSALTANSHRIHYDEPYCRAEEGYPGLVVHGPLLATLMLELVRDRPVRKLAYRLRAPLFAGEPLSALGTATGDGATLRIASAREPRHATAEVTFA